MQAVLTVAVIPARAGSRGLPGKHLRLLGGEPMIAHTIRASLAARSIDRTIVSTDDTRIARIARRLGAEVPFLRPAELAADDTPTLPVIQHAVAWLEASGSTVDLAVTLQPTSPLRDGAEIDAVVSLLADPAVGSAVSVASLGHPISVVGALRQGRFEAVSVGDPRRQASAPAARITGAVYVTRRALLGAGRLLDDRPAAHLVAGPSAIDVDTADDLAAARRAWRARKRTGA
jgi:CMP-N-acetylneuraminic acid synthetase